MTEFTGEVHPLADDYPMLGADELNDLAESIKDQGQLDPITLTPDGALLDGRNRLAACDLAGVEPKFEIHDGDAVAFIVGKNANRRQLSAGQRAMAIAIGMWESGQWDADKGHWKRGAAKKAARTLLNSKHRFTSDLAHCGAILAHNRDTAVAVLAGASLQATYKQVKDEQEAAVEHAQKLDELRDKAPDLLAQVSDEKLTFEEAYAAYEARHAKQIKAEKDAAQSRRDMRDELVYTVANCTTFSHPDNFTKALDGIAEHPHKDTTADTLRQSAQTLNKIADAMQQGRK